MAAENRKRSTLIEVVIVAVATALLAAVAIPRYRAMVLRARAGFVLGHIARMRKAIQLYYADTGDHPQIVNDTLPLAPKYINEIPAVEIHFPRGGPAHFIRRGRGLTAVPGEHFDAALPGKGTYAWVYNSLDGTIAVACVHPDSLGRPWSSY
jgi:Tfp pilus assembly protein PilE